MQHFILRNMVAKCWQSWIHALKNNLCCLSHLIIWHIFLNNFGLKVFLLFLSCFLSFSLSSLRLFLSFYNVFPLWWSTSNYAKTPIFVPTVSHQHNSEHPWTTQSDLPWWKTYANTKSTIYFYRTHFLLEFLPLLTSFPNYLL